MKLSAPYWFHLLSYQHRIILAGLLMASSFLLVGLGALKGGSIGMQLFGVVMGSMQSGLGETSFLALTAFYEPSRKALTCWGSGTGCAGIFGYAWVVCFTIFFKLSFTTTLLSALVLPVAYIANFALVLRPKALKRDEVGGSKLSDEDENMKSSLLSQNGETINPIYNSDIKNSNNSKNNNSNVNNNSSTEDAMAAMTLQDKVRNTIALWPFMVPLFVVYFSEYAMQSGVWSAIGFPLDSQSARNAFYVYGNWTYQVGVFVSRSSGMFWKADMRALWTMPTLQFLLLVFFVLDAFYEWWYNWALLVLCFVAGLFGGAVYVGGFSLMSETVDSNLKEV
jgi:battenin